MARTLRTLPIAVLVALHVAGASAQDFPAPLTPAEVAEARSLITEMKASQRGPYRQLRWFCADGTVHPPQGSPCRERGGGVQHAQHSQAADRLSELDFHVGTILQAMSYEDFADEEHGGYRLREMVLERYLFEVNDGWVLRHARYYRGALQIEDEERAGRSLLARRFDDADWLRSNFFLATRLAAALPHERAGDDRTMDRIRATALQISNADSAFLPIRVRIHSVPSRADIAAVEAYLDRGGHPPQVREWLSRLLDDLRRRYDPARALSSIAAYRERVGPDLRAGLDRVSAAVEGGDPGREFQEIVDLAPGVRDRAQSGVGGATAVDLVDLVLSLNERAFALSEEVASGARSGSRTQALDRVQQYAALAYSAGYLSAREREALEIELDRLRTAGETTALAYKRSLGYVARVLDWAHGTVQGTFGPVVDRYAPVEPAAAGLTDALLRGSALLPLARVISALQTDADAVLGASSSLFGARAPTGLRGINAGVAMRTLRVLEPGGHDDVDAGTIYVLPETPPELKPVAGVLTMDEGNLLSHVQLLARNLGIPNATLTPDLLPRTSEADGREVFFAVSPLGRVILAWPDRLGPTERSLVDAESPIRGGRLRLDTSRLRLDVRRPIALFELRAGDSGVTVGPKAANLAQLAADFPGRVSPGVVLPFGIFVEHVERPWSGSNVGVLGELRSAYRRAEEMEAEGRPEDEIDAYVLDRLRWVREAIVGLDWMPASRERIEDAVRAMLEGEIGRGVFVRSDTNVEDLPQFSGAGLNLTVPNQTSMEEILAAIKEVWTSPFSERAYLWRRQILEEQGAVYPSVLLQRTVPSEKSGVLITSGLQEGGPEDLTVVAAEGVGGAVEGQSAETLLLKPDGTVRLLSQAKAPRKREVVPGGTRWVVAERPEVLLQPGELAQLRSVVSELRAMKEGTPEADTTWDIEFGFVDGRLWLLQIRPFIRFRSSDLHERLAALDAGALANADRTIRLDDPLEAP